MPRPVDQDLEPVRAAAQRVLLVIREVDDAVTGPQLVDLLVLPGEARAAEHEDDLLRGAVRVGRGREPSRVDPNSADAESRAADGVAEPLPARRHLALLGPARLDLVPVRDVLVSATARSPSFRVGAGAGAELSLHLRQLVVDLRLRGQLCELAVELRVAAGRVVLEGARRDQLVHRRCARLHLLGLVLRPLDGGAGVGHLVADPGRGLADPDRRLRGRVLGLHHFLLAAERLDLRRERLLVRLELLLLLVQLGDLPVEILELRLSRGLALERHAGEVLAVGAERLARLRLQLRHAGLELARLELQPLLRRDDVRDAALDVLEQLELLLV